MIASSLLLLMEEEDAFWMLCTIVEDILPASYYSSTLLGKWYFLLYLDIQIEHNICFHARINHDLYD
jgi:hypothetical protein